MTPVMTNIVSFDAAAAAGDQKIFDRLKLGIETAMSARREYVYHLKARGMTVEQADAEWVKALNDFICLGRPDALALRIMTFKPELTAEEVYQATVAAVLNHPSKRARR